jgi:hypothetical protein
MRFIHLTPGVNMLAHPLTNFEMSEITASPTILARVRRAYELMLDFYGMKLLDTESGLIGRKDHDWETRYQNLTCKLYILVISVQQLSKPH